MTQSYPKRQGGFAVTWLLVIVYVAIIFGLSAQPNLRPPFHFQNSDKLMHLVEYGGLGLLLARALWASRPHRSALFVVCAALALGMAIAGLDERFQSFILGRDSSVFDWLADSSGLCLSQLVQLIVVKDEEL
ncbi:MAG: VanZ family protein [Candidatus Eisenbacteria bacterium]